MFDIHCHIVFGVDDGSRSLEESKAMVKAAYEHGVDTIMCTPHCRWDSFDKELVQQNFEVLQRYAAQLGVTMDLGYEVNWKKLAELGIDRAPEFTLGETNLFLFELSDASLPPNWEQTIAKLQDMGLQVIIAHPERYRAVQNDLGVARAMKEMGCYLQLSANFVEGGVFDARKRTATALLKEDLVDYVASDAHCVEDYDVYAKALAYCRKF